MSLPKRIQRNELRGNYLIFSIERSVIANTCSPAIICSIANPTTNIRPHEALASVAHVTRTPNRAKCHPETNKFSATVSQDSTASNAPKHVRFIYLYILDTTMK